MNMWTKYQARYLIRKRYKQVRREEVRESAALFVQFVKVVGITMLVFAVGYVLLVSLMFLPLILLILLAGYIYRKRRKR